LEGKSKLNYVRGVERITHIIYVRLHGSINMDWIIKINANCVFLVQRNCERAPGVIPGIVVHTFVLK
jgi:hypothetical protein